MILSGSAKLAAVIGWPVRHSLSPLLHGHWLARYGIDGVLVPLAVMRENFSGVVDALRRAGFKGASVTLPHKEAALALADECDAAALSAGAANLLIFQADGRILARNTDGAGLMASLGAALRPGALKGQPVVLLGAGGAARGAVLALDAMGASEIRLLARNPDRAESLARTLASHVQARIAPGALSAAWAPAVKGARLLLNATSAGMENRGGLDLDLSLLPADAAVCDIVYNPLETDLLKRAKAGGHTAIDGLGMLMHQAVPAFEAFFGIMPEVTPELRGVLEKALHG